MADKTLPLDATGQLKQKYKDNGDGTYSLVTAIGSDSLQTLTAAGKVILLEGVTDTAGTDTMLLDSTKDIEFGALDNKLVKFEIDGIEYMRKILGAVRNSIIFATTRVATGAVAELGEVTLGEGQIEISVAADGENYSVEFVAGTGNNSAARADYAEGVLSLVSGTDGNGDPVAIMPGNVQGLITANAEAAAIFTATSTFAGYGLPVTFAETVIGEDDAITIGEGIPDLGSVQVQCIGSLIGGPGNDYAIEIVQGSATTGDNLASLSGDTNVLTITVNLTAGGEVRFLSIADLQTLLANDVVTSNKFEVIADSIQAGALLPTTAPVDFAGGIPTIPVPSGTPYTVIDVAPEAVGATLLEQQTQDDATEGVLTFTNNIAWLEIDNGLDSVDGTFTVNGITINVLAGHTFKAKIGGTPGKTVSVTGATKYTVSQYS